MEAEEVLTLWIDLPQWNKNWYCSSESLWYDRWQQILEVQPDFVEIITCSFPSLTEAIVKSANIGQGTTMESQATSMTPIATIRLCQEQTPTSRATHTTPTVPFCLILSRLTRLERPRLSQERTSRTWQSHGIAEHRLVLVTMVVSWHTTHFLHDIADTDYQKPHGDKEATPWRHTALRT